MAKLINGNGNRAIYAAQDADLIASLAGNVTCIANVGNKYAATIEDANTIGLADGVIITKEGRRIQLDAGDVDLFAIPTGSSGVTNYYIIGYKLVQQADSSQVAETFVQKMNSSSATIAEGTLRGGDNEVYVSVYRVTQVGFNIDSVDGLLPELLDNSAIKEDINRLNGDCMAIPYFSKVTGNNNVAWKDCPDGESRTYFYEGADTNTYDLPYMHVFVFVQKLSNIRGYAIAYKWANWTNEEFKQIWINQLQDTWKGWCAIGNSVTTLMSRRLLTNNSNFSLGNSLPNFSKIRLELLDNNVAGAQVLDSQEVPLSEFISGNFYYKLARDDKYVVYRCTLGNNVNILCGSNCYGGIFGIS